MNKYEYIPELDFYFDEIKDVKILSKEEECELAIKIKNGDDNALNKLITANLKFVVNIAKLYRKSGVPFSDLISEGNIGLIRAAKKFDENRDIRFTSYAVWWIKNSIQECIERYNSFERSTEDFIINNTSEYEIQHDIINIRDENENYNKQSQKEIISNLMQNLKEREINILELYYGLTDGKEMTLDEIGQNLSLTQERVRQIKDKSLVKLRSNALISDDYEIIRYL